MFDCSFDDDGLYTLLNACPPIQKKIIKPLEPLSAFKGEDKAGDWVLEVVTDRFLSGQANFYGFKLDICSEIKVSNPFLLTNLGLKMEQGQTRGIGQDKLESQDADNTASELTYTIVAVTQRGDLYLNGTKVDYGTRFTQKDINDGKLTYQHTGGPMETDGFLFVVEDGTGGWFGTDYFKIQIGSVSTRDEETKLSIHLFPNPAQSYIDISTSQSLEANARIRVLNLNGTELIRESISLIKALLLDFSSLSNGIYLF